MVGHLFQNYETIYVRFFPTYTSNHSCYTILRAFFCHVYLRSFLLCGYKRAYMCAQKSLYIYMRYKQACIRGIELYRQPKTPSCTMEMKGNFGLNHGCNGRVHFEQGLVLIHCPHSSDGCWLPDNEFDGIRGLSLERLWTLFHECWPKQRSIHRKK